MIVGRKLLGEMVLLTLVFISLNANADSSKEKVNPLSTFITVPFKASYERADTSGNGNILRIMPFVPFTVGDWNLFNRAVFPVARVDGSIIGPNNPSPEPGGATSGLGDITYALVFSPRMYDTYIWGLGPAITLPTASDDQLGSGKWSAGIAGMVLRNFDWGKVMIRGRQVWSFAGDSNRTSVSQTVIDPLITYNMGDGWHLFTNPIISANWKVDKAKRWILPLGGGFGRTFKVGDQKILSRLEYYYNVERPEGAPDHSLSLTVQFVIPKQ